MSHEPNAQAVISRRYRWSQTTSCLRILKRMPWVAKVGGAARQIAHISARQQRRCESRAFSDRALNRKNLQKRLCCPLDRRSWVQKTPSMR